MYNRKLLKQKKKIRELLKEIVYKLSHYLCGALTVLAVKIHAILSVILFVGFVIYEIDEEKMIKDYAFEELREYLVGFCIVLILLLIR